MALEECVQRMSCSVCIPERKRAVVVETRRQLMHRAVHATVLAVNIIEESRGEHQMIEGGIEDFFVFLI